MTTAERQRAQQVAALKLANQVRSDRHELKVELHDDAGPLACRTLLDPPGYALTMRVFDLLLAVPKYGRVKANKVLYRCGISPSRTLGSLSDRQRRELVAILRSGPSR